MKKRTQLDRVYEKDDYLYMINFNRVVNRLSEALTLRRLDGFFGQLCGMNKEDAHVVIAWLNRSLCTNNNPVPDKLLSESHVGFVLDAIRRYKRYTKHHPMPTSFEEMSPYAEHKLFVMACKHWKRLHKIGIKATAHYRLIGDKYLLDCDILPCKMKEFF